MKRKSVIRSISVTVICLLLGTVIALQLKSVNSAQNLSITENRRISELQTELLEVMDQNDDLVETIENLNIALAQADTETAGQQSQIQRIILERDNAKIFAGLTDVSGPGGIITLISDQDAVIRDIDLRLIVNYLRASGAQAISINGQRLVSMSEIVPAGTSIVINGKSFPSTGQFEIRVITEQENFVSALNLLNTYLNDLRINGVDVSHVTQDRVQIERLREDSPAYRKDLLVTE